MTIGKPVIVKRASPRRCSGYKKQPEFQPMTALAESRRAGKFPLKKFSISSFRLPLILVKVCAPGLLSTICPPVAGPGTNPTLEHLPQP